MKDSNLYYKLDANKKVIPCDIIEWVMFRSKKENRKIKKEIFQGKIISTVFININLSLDDDIVNVFETIVFNNELERQEQYCDCYATYQEAVEGHELAK